MVAIVVKQLVLQWLHQDNGGTIPWTKGKAMYVREEVMQYNINVFDHVMHPTT